MSEYSQTIRGDVDGMVRRYEYDDCTVVVADVGATDGTVDVVDGTAIVVVGDDQYELDLPAGPSRAIMNNGIVSIDLEDTQ